ncbi:flagellar basal body-associated FliL family protein [Niveibacterium sp. 24ML]|uniref:flagellar basal body-associated FliL family protein n=1 Tax=Niveibacterium sp. 24ML TaxID=2985512 RepID=UPI00226DF55B|nr:flagellar basal body-associated FliL family protein [Niveibacterium sp. 24ML]MCX9156286.1 flagellar basal body-associated FliL family protein [Niveibacterium sp. 24ML]
MSGQFLRRTLVTPLLIAATLGVPATAVRASDAGKSAAAGPAPMQFVVNIGKTGRGGTVLQVQVVLEAATPAASQTVDAYKPQLQHDINLIIARQTPESLRTAEGKNALAEQILESVNETLGTKPKNGVKQVLFTHFILQQP